ncbi:uncharacterized protein UMAG_15076 [Mycosarcoma maydis]|uniref:Uncharacterized protein n=1 Tax=Mycosarcoma maydis TaxID=5270 RepID=A0A0D1CA00_MYCMD|nr:uncharacterized protein UMAG_15076 [Ustilago maydis 521]KIS70152.1 hypothetical protein UMAG_15076 [Ustilago maydis 521]|eukprot:XP_011388421.1 hypothetical protein UMAG_15076 [Ustilago maydis 521]
MLPHGRDNSTHPSSARRPVSDKEEMARAALRSLSGPSTSPTSNDAPFLPRPPQPSPSYAPAPGPSQPSYRQFAHAASRHLHQYHAKLQTRSKSTGAKGKAALIAENANNKSHKGIKAKKLTASISAAKAAKSDATGPSKRSASNLSKLHSPLQAPAQDATSQASQSNSPPRTTTTAKKSAATKSTTSVAGVPAAKVRRTSASSQQKPDLKPSPAASPNAPVTTRTSSRPPATIEQALSALSPKPSSPPPKENSTPTSIEAALLSPTDNPTPSQAAAQHAQRLFRSPLPPERAVETASGQALPADLPGAGQMNASSATKQQTSKSGVDSIIQASQSNEPTDQSSAIA